MLFLTLVRLWLMFGAMKMYSNQEILDEIRKHVDCVLFSRVPPG